MDRSKTTAVRAADVRIERVKGKLADADGRPCGVVCCPNEAAVYLAADAQPSFADGVRAGVTLAGMMVAGGLPLPIGEVDDGGVVRFKSRPPSSPSRPKRAD